MIMTQVDRLTLGSVIVHEGPEAKIIDSPIPKPGPNDVLIKVVSAGANPKDWKVPEMYGRPANGGDDIAGYVHEVGANISEFKQGDRVAAFHNVMTPGPGFADYGLAPANLTFHIPNETKFEEAATIPLAAMTAAIGLYISLGLPEPWKKPAPQAADTPLLVYGGATSVGAFVIKLAKKGGLHPIIAVAGRGANLVETLLDRSKGDTIVDYRNGDEATVEGIKEALGGKKLFYAYDAVTEHNSTANIAQVLEAQGGKYTCVLPDEGKLDTGAKSIRTIVYSAFAEDEDFAHLMFRYMAKGLRDGWFNGHPYEVVPGGLDGVDAALKELKAGKVSGMKKVFNVQDKSN